MRFLFSVFLIVGLSQTLSAQNSNVDSLKSALPGTTGKQRIITLLEICWQYRFTNADSARVYGQEALTLAKEQGDLDLQAEALNHLGVTHEAQGNYDEALQLELEALKIRRSLGDVSKTANTLNTLGIIHDERGEYQQALEYYYEARKIYEELKDESKIAMVLTNIGIIHRAQNELRDAARYYATAMSIYQKLGNKFGMAACHSNLGALYLNMNRYDSAIYFSLLAAKEFEEQNIRQFLPTSLSNAAVAYEKTNQLEDARLYFSQAMKLHEEYGNKKELSFTLSQLGRVEGRMNRIDSGVKFAERGLAIAQEISALEQTMQARKALADIWASAGKFDKAYREHQLYLSVKDSLFKIEKAKQLMELQTKYDSEKKDRQISDLNKDNQLKTATIQRNYFLIGGLVVLIALGVALLYLWRARERHQQQVVLNEQKMRMREAQITAVIDSQEKERRRFASDLHDGMGQLISALQLNIQALRQSTGVPEKRDAYFESSEQLITEVHDEIRNIAFNLMPPVLVKEGLVAAVAELVRKINKVGKIKASISVFDLEARLPEIVEISLYRIIQEFLSNIMKYSQATEVTIAFTGYESEVVLTIDDNGVGYNLQRFKVSEGNGWRNINSRLNLIKASIEMDVVEGRRNNTVIITLPLSYEAIKISPGQSLEKNTDRSV